MFSLYFFAVTILIIVINVLLSKQEKSLFFILETSLKWLFLLVVGLGGLMAALGHIFNSDEVAKQIGWAAGSPFQLEVAAANLSIAILGISSFWFRKMYWLATALAYAVFLYGAALVHISEMMNNNNYAQLNSGFFLWFSDVIVPTLLLITVLVYLKISKSNNTI